MAQSAAKEMNFQRNRPVAVGAKIFLEVVKLHTINKQRFNNFSCVLNRNCVMLPLRAGGRAPRTPWPGGLTYAQGSHARCKKIFGSFILKYIPNIK